MVTNSDASAEKKVKFVESTHLMDPVELLRHHMLEYVKVAGEAQLRLIERLQMEDIQTALERVAARAEQLHHALTGEEALVMA